MCLGWAGAGGREWRSPRGPPCSWERAAAPCARREEGLGVAVPPQTPSCIPREGAGSDPGRRATPWPTSTGGLEGQSFIIRN